MSNTYSTAAVPRKPRVECHDCGASADIIFVPDSDEDATGYRGDVALCRACLRVREART